METYVDSSRKNIVAVGVADQVDLSGPLDILMSQRSSIGEGRQETEGGQEDCPERWQLHVWKAQDVGVSNKNTGICSELYTKNLRCRGTRYVPDFPGVRVLEIVG